MKRFYFLGGFFSVVLVACFFMATPVSASVSDMINRIFRNNEGEQNQRTVAQIQQSKQMQVDCALTICTEEPVDQHNLDVCRTWANQTFGRNDCTYVDAAVFVEYRCLDEYRCIPNPNQTEISNNSRAACDEILQNQFQTNECSLVRPSLISDLFANLSVEEKRRALRIQNSGNEAISCVQTICLNQNGGTVRAQDLRVCRAWSDLHFDTTQCSDLRRIINDGSIESESYHMTQEDEFSCVAALCGENFVEITQSQEQFCQEWAQFNYGTNQCNRLLETYAPQGNLNFLGMNVNRMSDRRIAYEIWKEEQRNPQQNENEERNQFSQGNAIPQIYFENMRDANQLNECIPILLEQIPPSNTLEGALTRSGCTYLAERYGFYDDPTPSQITQCELMGIPSSENIQEQENPDIQRIRCHYWSERATQRGDRLQVNPNIIGSEENVELNKPELFFQEVTFENNIYTVIVSNSGFIPEPQINPQLLARWIFDDSNDNINQIFNSVQVPDERRWIFQINTNDLSPNFPPRNAFHLEFFIDPNDSIKERNEQNNVYAIAPKPDFRMVDIGNTQINQTGILPIVIRNQAPRSVHEGSVPFHFQWIDNRREGVGSFEGIAFMVARNHLYQADLPLGEFPDRAVGFRIRINHNETIPEMSYQNNIYQYFFAPDLVIDEVVTEQNELVVRVQNIGNTTIPIGDFYVQATWISNENLSRESNTQTVRQQGQENEWILRFPLSSAPKDVTSVHLRIDRDNLINETNERNNTADYAFNESGIVLFQQNLDDVKDSNLKNSNILPGTFFYNVKEAWRSFRLGIILNPTKKAQYMLDIASKRKNEQFEVIRRGNDLPANIKSPLPLDKFLDVLKNIPESEASKKQEFLNNSIPHIQFEYQEKSTRKDGIIVFEYTPNPEEIKKFVKILTVAEGEVNKREILNTLSQKDFGSAQKHMQTALKLSAIAEESSEELKSVIISEQNQLTKKITQSLKKETPSQQKLLLDVVPVTEKTLDQTKILVQTLSEEVQDETIKKAIFAPKFLEIEALQKTGSSLPDTSKTITVIPPTLTTTTTSTLTPPITCQDDGQIVCGKDGKTYTSTCAAQKAGVTVVSEGKCRETIIIPPKPPEPIIITKPTTTIVIPTPECTSNKGCDDKNSCTQNSCINGKCVYKKYNDCGTSEYSCTDGVDNDRNGQIDCKDSACSTLSYCEPVSTCDDSEPVCGRDGVTYSSECAAKAKGVIVDSYGKCPITQTNTFDTINIKTLDTKTLKIPSFNN